MGHDGAVRLI